MGELSRGLHLEKLEGLVNQHRRPGDGLDNPEHAFPEGARMLDKIDECADESHAIDAAGDAVLVHFCSRLGEGDAVEYG